MALIKTIQEIRALIPHLSRLSNNAGIPNVEKSAQKHIVSIIGSVLYDDLNTKYNVDPTTLSDGEQALVKIIQLPLTAFSYLDDIGLIQATITDSGIRRTSTAEMPAVFRWEFEELKDTLTDYAADGIEILIKYLYAHKADFTSWTDSDEFKEIDGFLIQSGADFDKQYKLYQPNRTFWLMKSIMSDVEENYLCSMLGRDLFGWVKTQTSIVVADGSGEVDVKKILKKAAAHLTIKHACQQLPIRIDQYGFTITEMRSDAENPNISGRGNASTIDRELQMKAADKDGQNYLKKSADYLVNIARGIFDFDFDGDFTTAFDKSPLNTPVDQVPVTNGNERRKIFRF